MRKLKLLSIVLLYLISGQTSAKTQETMVTMEEDAGFDGGSVGQLAFATGSKNDGSMDASVLQMFSVGLALGFKKEISFDMNGSLFRNAHLQNNQSIIPTDDLAEATYLVEVSIRKKRLKPSRILKR